MISTLEALTQDFTADDTGSFVYEFGDGYELWFERLLFDNQYCVALYKKKAY